jgi:hypothetical protein
MEDKVGIEESKTNQLPDSITVDSSSISTAPTLLAWCSQVNNNISVIDIETKQDYVTFDGARISDTGISEIL